MLRSFFITTERDSGKDHTIVSLYLFTVVSLLIAAALRNHLAVWYDVSFDREWRRG